MGLVVDDMIYFWVCDIIDKNTTICSSI